MYWNMLVAAGKDRGMLLLRLMTKNVLTLIFRKLALTSCRVAGGFVLWRQNPWSLILQGFCGFCLFVWECQLV